MRGTTRLIAAAMIGGLGLLGSAADLAAQSAAPRAGAHLTPEYGSIEGVVRDEKGAPVAGAMVSAIGASTAFALSDKVGRFELRTLSPGSYLVRAHLSGFAAPRGQVVDVRASGRAVSSLALSRMAESYPVLEAGMTLPMAATAEDEAADAPAPAPANAGPTPGTIPDDHSETAWRLRHGRRSVLKDAAVPVAVLAEEADRDADLSFFSSTARLATNFFADTPFSGQFSLLTTGTFDTPQQLFRTDSFSRSVTDVWVTAPAAGGADWTVRGALTQGDVSSWIVAGSYVTRDPARHVYDIGMSFSRQRYNAGNPGAFGEIDGSRDAGMVYGFDTFTISPAIAVTYGASYARYDYLESRNLWSPQVEVAITPAERFRIKTLVSRRVVAPGAEEFAAPADAAPWQPTQRTFSPLRGGPLDSERTLHAQVDLEHDFGDTTLLVRGFTQHVMDQLVTIFGANIKGRPVSSLGHYFVGANGSAEATGWATGVRTSLADRVHASVEYTLTRARWTPVEDLSYVIVVEPSSATEPSRIHNVSTAVETEVPETSTRLLVLYRVSNGFAQAVSPEGATDRTFDSRFDVQVRQSLPFLDFTSAKWEMLVAVKNFFREVAADQSVYDELLVIRPPKRIMGGLTLHF
jgi:hypothetical protein